MLFIQAGNEKKLSGKDVNSFPMTAISAGQCFISGRTFVRSGGDLFVDYFVRGE